MQTLQFKQMTAPGYNLGKKFKKAPAHPIPPLPSH